MRILIIFYQYSWGTNRCYAQTILFCLLFLDKEILSAQYPIAPMTQQSYISGTVGEEREGRDRYHYGLDFRAAATTRVHAVEAGTLRRVSGSMCSVGNRLYIHVTNVQLKPEEVSKQVGQGEYICDVAMGEHPHLHLQQSSNALSNDFRSAQYEDYNIGWVNPLNSYALGNLGNFQDTERPRIDYVRLYDDGGATERTNQPLLFGKLDILVNTEDAHTGENGAATGTFRNAPYLIDCSIFAVNNMNYDVELNTIPFQNVPPNASARAVLGPLANHYNGNSEYWVTHDAFNDPYDKYWNTRQRKGRNYNIDAQIPFQCQYPDGLSIRIRVTSNDAGGNSTERILPEGNIGSPGRNYYTIDNFNPYVHGATVSLGNTTIYKRQWNQVGYEGDMQLSQASTNNLRASDFTNPGNIVVTATASEDMSEMYARIDDLYPGVRKKGEVIDWNKNGQKVWKFTFDPPAPAKLADPAKCYQIRFEGRDLVGNQILALNHPLCSNAGSTTSMRIPVREANGWNPVRPQGEDACHSFRFEGQQQCDNR
jgi:hypothetical protein